MTATNLSSEGRAGFSIDWNIYTQSLKTYEKEQDSIKALKEAITNTVAAHIFSLCCKPADSLADWYTKLVQQISLSTKELDDEARQKYHEATRVLYQLP